MSQEDGIFNQLNDLPNVRSIQAISQFQGDLLIVTSEKDQIIPESIPEAYLSSAAQAKSKERITLIGAPHGLSGSIYEAQFIEILKNWLFKINKGDDK